MCEFSLDHRPFVQIPVMLDVQYSAEKWLAWETQETSRNPSTDERHQPMNTYAFYNPSRNTYAAYEGFVISLLSVAQNHWPQRKYAEILNILNPFGTFCYPYFEPCRSSTGSASASAMMIFEGFHARWCHRSVNPRLGQSRRSGASDGLGTTAPIIGSFDSLEVFSWFEVQTYRSRWQNDTYLILQVGILNYNYIMRYIYIYMYCWACQHRKSRIWTFPAFPICATLWPWGADGNAGRVWEGLVPCCIAHLWLAMHEYGFFLSYAY